MTVKRVAAAAATLTAVTLGAQPASASTATACSVAPLAVPDGTTYSIVNGADPTGHFLAGFAASDTVEQAVVWQDGTLSVLPIPLSSPRAGAVNPSGTVVGTGFGGGGNARAWLFANGQYQELLGPSGATQSFGVGVNRVGDVLIGYSDANYVNQVAIRFASTGELRTLPLPAGVSATPTGISDDDTVTARATTQDGLSRSFVWNSRGMRRELHGTTPGASVYVVASAGHWAVGSQFDPATGTGSGLRWDLRKHTVEALPAELDVLESVNDLGAAGGAASSVPAIAQDGQLTRLPELPGTISGDVSALSSAGVAAGSNIDPNYLTQAVIWTQCF
jgi:uncharacterized membrane protein